jgi:hypothetical protein
MMVVQISQLYSDLWKQAKCQINGQQLQEALNSDWKVFPTYSSDGNYLRIEDKHRYLLIYRLPILTQYTETLVATADLIPSSSSKEYRRGQTSEKYWGLWRKYAKELRISRKYYRDLSSSHH